MKKGICRHLSAVPFFRPVGSSFSQKEGGHEGTEQKEKREK